MRSFAFLVMSAALVGCGAEGGDDAAVDTGKVAEALSSGANLRVTTFTQTTRAFVDGYQQFSVTVENVGAADANSTTLKVDLLATQTTPQYLLGSLESVPAGCSRSNWTLSCDLGRVRYNGPASGRRRTVTFGYKIPVTTQAMMLVARVSSPSEPANNTGDNTLSLTANVDYRAVSVTAGIKTPSHCTGTGLSAYYECTLFPSSISSHQAEYHSNGTITFPATTSYSGTWSQPDPQSLHFEYSNGSFAEAIFDGYGADPHCFEGITRFYVDDDQNPITPPVLSTYDSAYRVCF